MRRGGERKGEEQRDRAGGRHMEGRRKRKKTPANSSNKEIFKQEQYQFDSFKA